MARTSTSGSCSIALRGSNATGGDSSSTWRGEPGIYTVPGLPHLLDSAEVPVFPALCCAEKAILYAHTAGG